MAKKLNPEELGMFTVPKGDLLGAKVIAETVRMIFKVLEATPIQLDKVLAEYNKKATNPEETELEVLIEILSTYYPDKDIHISDRGIDLLVPERKEDPWMATIADSLQAEPGLDISVITRICHASIIGSVLKREIHKAEERAKKAEERANKAEKQARALQKKTGVFKVGGHLAEQNFRRPQLGLFEQPLEDIKPISHEVRDNLDLNAEEHLLVLSFAKLLHLHSQTDNPQAPDYYLGNRQVIPEEDRASDQTKKPVIIEDPTARLPVAQLMVSTYDIAREYIGGGNPSGGDLNTVDRLVEVLSKKTFTIEYKRTIQGKGRKGKITTETQTVSTTQPLIWLYKVKQERNAEREQTAKRSAKTITLNPIFTDQIGTKFLSFPEDYIKRLREAWNSKRIPKVLTLLGTYLNGIRAGLKGAKVEPHKIYVSNLLEKLDPATYKKSKKRAIDQVEKCLDTCREIKLIEDWHKEPGATGELLYHIQIAKKWE